MSFTKIGRVHKQKDVFTSFERARALGFDNISLDLMFGLPGQTLADLDNSVKTALSLDAEHYSVYSLIVEPKTVFYNLMQKAVCISRRKNKRPRCMKRS